MRNLVWFGVGLLLPFFIFVFYAYDAFAINGVKLGTRCFALSATVSGQIVASSKWRFAENFNTIPAWTSWEESYLGPNRYTSVYLYAHEWQTDHWQQITAKSIMHLPTQKLDEYLEQYDLTLGQTPHTYWPDGPPDEESCSDVEVNCADLAGNSLTEYMAVTDTAPFCWNGCEITSNGLGVVIPGTSIIIMDFTITGEAAAQGCTEPLEQEEINNCQEAEDYCNEACKGLDMNFDCDNDTGQYSCGCTYPPYQRQYDPDTNEMKTDSDQDGLTNDDPTETDMDNDGETDSEDSDPDGDTFTTTDKDSDNDGSNNRGEATWADQNADWGSHNGIGTDADGDLDNDGLLGCNDPDMDGDGISNLSDPDMDGDGVPNSSDLDANGNNLLDGSEDDPDCDGISNSDDIDPTGPGGDSDGDGDIDSDDPPVADDGGDGEWPTEEEINTGYDGVGDNTYDSTIAGDFTDPDFQGAITDIMEANPLDTDLDGSEIQLTNIDSCIDFPNPYTGGTESFCFNKYDTYWKAMGFLFIGMVGFMCFRLIAWRY